MTITNFKPDTTNASLQYSATSPVTLQCPANTTDSLLNLFSSYVNTPQGTSSSFTPTTQVQPTSGSQKFQYKVFSGEQYICTNGAAYNLCTPVKSANPFTLFQNTFYDATTPFAVELTSRSPSPASNSSSTTGSQAQHISQDIPQETTTAFSSVDASQAQDASQNTVGDTSQETTTEKLDNVARDWFSNLPALDTMGKIGIATLALAGVSYAIYKYLTPPAKAQEKEEALPAIKPVEKKPITLSEKVQNASHAIWNSIQSSAQKFSILSRT